MSVYKEGYYAVSQILNNSKQIWNDSADFGAPYKKGDQIWNLVVQLATDYGINSTIVKHPTYSEITVALMDEWNTKRVQFFRITAHKDYVEINEVPYGCTTYFDLLKTRGDQYSTKTVTI